MCGSLFRTPHAMTTAYQPAPDRYEAGSPNVLGAVAFAAACEALQAIGMDAVRTTIRGLGGEVTMTSELGHGTSTEIRMPLTLAIMPALVVGTDGAADGSRYAIPLDRIEVDRLEDILTDAWLVRAPKKAAAAFLEQTSG